MSCAQILVRVRLLRWQGMRFGTSIIRSLQAEAVLTEDRANEFFGSIQTVLTQLLEDFADLQSGSNTSV